MKTKGKGAGSERGNGCYVSSETIDSQELPPFEHQPALPNGRSAWAPVDMGVPKKRLDSYVGSSIGL